MTQPPPLLDAGNTLLTGTPNTVVLGTIETSDGVQGVVTIRTASTTLTLIMPRDEVATWAGNFAQLRDMLPVTRVAVVRPALVAGQLGQVR